MLKRSFPLLALLFALVAAQGFAQNANQSAPQTTRRRTTTTTTTTNSNTTDSNTPKTQNDANTTTTQEPARSRTRRSSNQTASGPKRTEPRSVVATFNALLDGIRAADVDIVTNIYWNSPQLVLFNSNGSVTKGWRQLRENRTSSYANLKDVKLDVRDLRVQMLGRDAALITCLWTQSQTVRGTSETASGRMTIVFRRIAGEWKAIHLHTSPDNPDQSRVLPSEQTTPSRPKPKP